VRQSNVTHLPGAEGPRPVGTIGVTGDSGLGVQSVASTWRPALPTGSIQLMRPFHAWIFYRSEPPPADRGQACRARAGVRGDQGVHTIAHQTGTVMTTITQLRDPAELASDIATLSTVDWPVLWRGYQGLPESELSDWCAQFGWSRSIACSTSA
jgi:hypothetical protein